LLKDQKKKPHTIDPTEVPTCLENSQSELEMNLAELERERDRLSRELSSWIEWAGEINAHPVRYFLFKKRRRAQHRFLQGRDLAISLMGRLGTFLLTFLPSLLRRRTEGVQDQQLRNLLREAAPPSSASRSRDILLFSLDSPEKPDLSLAVREYAKRGHRVFWISQSLVQWHEPRYEPRYELDPIDGLTGGYLVRLHANNNRFLQTDLPTKTEFHPLKKSLACMLRDFAITSSVSLLEHPSWLSLVQCVPNSYRVFDLQWRPAVQAKEEMDPFISQTELLRSADGVLVDRSWDGQIAETYVSKVMIVADRSDQERLGEDPTTITKDGEKAFSLQGWARRADDLEKLIETIPLPLVSVIVLTHNNLELTKTCLRSVIERSQYPNLEVLVVDNASTDGTVDYLKEFQLHHESVSVIFNRYNVGFAAGNNLGLAAATGEYLVLLNNDTVVTEGWILTLLHHFSDHPDIGLLGAVTNNIGNEAQVKIGYESLDEMPERSRAYTLAHLGELLFLRTVAFFCVMMPRRTYTTCGPISEAYGMGFFEDDDYCRKVEKAGLKIACAEDVFIHHHLSASFNQLKDKERRALFDRNRAIYEKRWGTWVPHRYRY
jgi:GT2 family glycosyltransferase